MLKVSFLKLKRLTNGISQREFAEMLGVTQAAVSQWEMGNTFPKTEYLPIIAKILGCTTDELVNGLLDEKAAAAGSTIEPLQESCTG